MSDSPEPIVVGENPPSSARRAASSSKMLREGGKLGLLTLASRILGLVREMTRAAFMGTGALADSFTVAFNLPNFLRRLFAENSMSAAFIPTFSGYLAEGNDEKSREFLSATFTVLTVLVTATVALGIACTPWIVKLFGSDPVETAVLTRIMFPFLALVSVAAFFQGILNSLGIFSPSGAAPIVFNVVFIAVPYVIAGPAGNPARAMAIGVVLGGLLQALVQLPFVLKAGWHFGFIGLRRAFGNQGMRKVMGLIGPTILGMAAYQVNILVSTSLASSAGTGAVSSLQYSLRLQEFVLGIFVVSAGTVLLPNLAGSAATGRWSEFSDSVGRGLRAMLLVTIPVALFSMIAGKDIVSLLFRAREFDEESVRLTTAAFFFHMTGLVFIAINRVLAPAFYACSDTKTPTRAGIISFGVNIAAAFALVGPLKGPGIALALSVASAVNSIVLIAYLSKKRLEGMGAAFGRSAAYALRLLLVSAVAALPVWLVEPRLARLWAMDGRLLASGLPLLVGATIFGVVAFGILLATRDEMAVALVGAVVKRVRRGK
ncbi:MAG TPA: murein biosynthesis integral membrane protein MurJ [Rectinemataceae bacterium]|nr:murein biosynthesis integral membrane protein MurJ [Rectinemataceae bacterium]